MVRKTTSKTSEPSKPIELAVSLEDARARIFARVDSGKELINIEINTETLLRDAKDKYRKWSEFNIELLKQLFTTNELSEEYSYTSSIGFISLERESLGEMIATYRDSIREKIRRLESILERLELYPLSSTQGKGSNQNKSSINNKKVFVVHGRDDLAKTNLEVFLHEINLEPIVLHRQADEGQTIIEKFEKHADVGYAFILLTPDEVAYLANEETLPDEERKKEKRARPNVIFEFGYFVGRLGRSKVCCLYTGNVALPSDVQGMIYKRYERSIEEVAYGVIKDLKASGYDLN